MIDESNKKQDTGEVDDMHDLITGKNGTPGVDEEDPLAAYRDDPNYSALIRDLEYIATEARRLFEPAQEEPSDALWDKIVKQLPGKPDA